MSKDYSTEITSLYINIGKMPCTTTDWLRHFDDNFLLCAQLDLSQSGVTLFERLIHSGAVHNQQTRWTMSSEQQFAILSKLFIPSDFFLYYIPADGTSGLTPQTF